MTTWNPRANDLFLKALELGSAGECHEFLEGACAGDAALRAEVESLLEASARAGRFLECPAPGLHRAATVDEPPVAERPGTVIGPYKLMEQIGEGGMGMVFVAEQSQPVRRKVALKLIKPGMDSKQVLARFEAERQALALMDHPNIAQVHDGGTTDAGRPYFVMELVKGIAITDYCDQNRLTTRQRLGLFLPVCQAVRHAHQKGIIHRDLKPSNILVTVHDVTPVPKVIDFGIAKAVGQRLTEHTLFTHFAQMIGTPLYMSPEQAERNGLDVDTRSDVYSLGVLLYELLTGTTPFEGEVLRQAGPDEVRRMIREDEPPRPSHRVSTLAAQASSTVSEQRGVDSRRLGQQLRGELDWVVMKALEKDRDRRYESASALAQDIQRYLNDEPVQACPPSAAYRLRKYVRRNRRALLPAGVVAVTLVAATAVSAWQAKQALDAQRQAEADRDRAETAEQKAATEAAIAKAVSDFFQHDLLRQVDPEVQRDEGFPEEPDLTVREALDRAAARIGDRFRDQHLVEAAIRTVIGDGYRSLGEPASAVRHLERALLLRQVHLGPDDPGTVEAINRLAQGYEEVGRRVDALGLYEKVVEKRTALHGADHHATLTAMTVLARAFFHYGQYGRAESLETQILAKRSATLGATHPDTLETMHSMAQTYRDLGRFDEAFGLYEKLLADCHDPDSRVWVLFTFAKANQMAGKLDVADRVLRDLLPHHRKREGRRAERGTAHVLERLALNLLMQERFAEAEPLAREAHAIYIKIRSLGSGPDDWRPFHCLSLVGGALLGQGRHDEAEPLLLEGYQGMKERETMIGAPLMNQLTTALERVVRFYEVTNQPEKAREWRAKLPAK